MDRRRGASNRPASSEELECWSHASASLSQLASMYTNPMTETVSRVNRLISAWPKDDNIPAEGYEGVKALEKKLTNGLDEIVEMSEKECKAIDEAIEKLGVVIALRRAPEAPANPEKRIKRPRVEASSATPAGSPAPNPPAPSRGMSITLPARTSGVNSPIPFSRDPKQRRAALGDQLPLSLGRKVAYHIARPPGSTQGADDQAEWILAVVSDFISGDKNRYIVRDADDSTQTYRTTIKSIIPLPDPDVDPTAPSHLNAYPQFSAGSTVMALYPDTTSFYKAEVVKSYTTTTRGAPHYQLKFEDDDGQVRNVVAHLVVEFPKT